MGNFNNYVKQRTSISELSNTESDQDKIAYEQSCGRTKREVKGLYTEIWNNCVKNTEYDICGSKQNHIK